MGASTMSFSKFSTYIHSPAAHLTGIHSPSLPQTCLQLRKLQDSHMNFSRSQSEGKRKGRASLLKANAFPDWPLMVVMVEHVAGQRDFVVHKSVWHLNEETMKNVYTMYIMFTCWGCCFFGSTKDPFYDGEGYRKDGGDGTTHWVYEKQEDIEAEARAELLREELIEEIEKKVGGMRELEEAGKEEELVK